MADDTHPGARPWSRFTAAAPTGSALPTDVATYGADIPAEPALRLLGPLDAKRVLDLGCGAGHASLAFARQGARVFAVDSSAEQVAAAREAAEAADVRVELHHGDLADLAFLRKDTVDVVFSAYALTEVDDLDRVFRQVHRVLKPEAPLVFSLPHPAYVMLDPAWAGDEPGPSQPPRLVRRYRDQTVIGWDRGDQPVLDHPRPLADVFLRLMRTNFRVDTLLEPEPAEALPRSRHWSPAMAWVPPTVVFRARKEGI